MGQTQERNILYSNNIARKFGLSLSNSEFNYGPGIGKADNYAIINDWLVVFEIEYSQRHPEFNVSKVWPYLENNPAQKLFLIQHIVDNKEVSANRIFHCEWMAEKMITSLNDRFMYQLIINDLTDNDIKSLKTMFEVINK